ncbi:hypothetical protein N0V90_004076 [Kalmusia sp. IMI 367209]|nr:hypothetical protein N0V90_004076 [Kalmusia sp. IMI 367209]
MSEDIQLTVTIQALQYADIDACARITAAAFSTDRHTIVKQLGGKPFDMFDVSRDGFLATLHRKTYIYVKAVDEAGNIVGHAGWGFRGIDEEKIPRKGPSDEPPPTEEEHEDQNEDNAVKEEIQRKEDGKKKGIDRLHEIEDDDMKNMMAELMPPGTSCMFFIGLIVDPSHQSHGVGSALIEYGNAIADRLNIFTWVHSSDQAWKAYAKFGFDIVKELDIELDEYAPTAPGEKWAKKLEGTGEGVTKEKWGHYVIRYMKRLP